MKKGTPKFLEIPKLQKGKEEHPLQSEEKIRLVASEAAAVCAYGANAPAFPDTVEDEDEFFLLLFEFAKTEYSIRASGCFDPDADVPTLVVSLRETEGLKINRKYRDALATFSAAAVMRDRSLNNVRVCLVETGNDPRSYEAYFDAVLAQNKLENLVSKLHCRLFVEKKFKAEAESSMRSLPFPYKSIREGQEKLVKRTYSVICKNGRLLAEAPTGTGKTISVLYAAARALGAGECDKIFYLTAKGSTATEAYKACERLFTAGAKIRCMQLAAKGKLCPVHPYSDGECDSYKCPRRKGYDERAEDALYELINSRLGYTVQTISEVAAKYSVCPYELSLDLSELCSVVICDYNYVFDPTVYIKRYFDDHAPSKRYVFLIDEAHNLVSRAKEMYSEDINREELLFFESELLNAAKEEDSSLYADILAAVSDYKKAFRRSAALCKESMITDHEGIKRGFYFSTEPISYLVSGTEKFLLALDDFKKKHKDSMLYDLVSDYSAKIFAFNRALCGEGKGMRYYIECADEQVTVRCMCVDPAVPISKRLEKSKSAVFFSATLTPADYYAKTLSGDEKISRLSLPSPFSKENLFCAAYTNLSTRFEDRDKNARRVLSLIGATLSGKKGNYMVYFPSYGYMRKVYELFINKYPKIASIIQTQHMTLSEKERFLAFFSDDTDRMRVGFCVLGGSFSEGVDLPGNRLIGTIIVGVGLPGISNEQNIVKEYYDFEGVDGYDFAYTYPGMNNVLQAAGRVIRSEKDKGIVIFADDRYADPKYRKLFPERFSELNFYEDVTELAEDITQFWLKDES